MLTNSRLIQVLEAPKAPSKQKVGRVFGGGNLGLSNEQWELVESIFHFRYMGAAEYEFGKFNQFMTSLIEAQKGTLTSFELTIPKSKIQRNHKKENKHDYPTAQTMYVICQADQKQEVSDRILELTKGKVNTRDSTWLDYALDPVDEYDREKQGWLEYSNGFAFFLSKTMFEGFRNLIPKDNFQN